MKKEHWILAGLGVAVAAAVTVLLTGQKKYRSAKPPKNAPQLSIENPGDQSEFPKAASESEMG